MGSVGSTFGAGKSAPDDKERVGIDSLRFWWLLGFALLIFSPVAVVLYFVASFTAQHRKVRVSRMWMWAAAGAVFSLGSLVVTGGSIIATHLAGWLSLVNIANWIGYLLVTAGDMFGFAPPALPAPVGLIGGILAQIPLSVAPALFFAACNIAWTRMRTAPLRQLEGKAYDAARPFGILDWIRLRRATHMIQTGKALDAKRNSVVIGAGRYGNVIYAPISEFQTPTLIFGKPRTGKTALACSLLGQMAQGGVLVLDFKGDGEIPRWWGRWAVARNRKFKHFQMAEKDGAPYRPPAEGAPSTPACYDPLRHGNADSKTDMLQTSVDREGDAAAYLRGASEFTLIAYQIAAVTGRTHGRSGFQVLHDLCDVGALVDAVNERDPATGQYYFTPKTNPQHAALIARVHEMEEKIKGDQMLRAHIASTRQLLSQYMNSAAVGPWLRPGDTRDNDIDLIQAVVDGHVVVFSLPTQDYEQMAKTIGTLVLLDLANCISSLRTRAALNQQNGVAASNEGMDWKPFYVQIEEFGSAAPEAVMSVLNKSGDVQIRPLLSTQSWSDVVEGMGEHNALRILDQMDNLMAFRLNANDGPEQISNMTEMVSMKIPRESVEYSAGPFGVDVKAANTGDIEPVPEERRQLQPSDIQTLGIDENRRWRRRRADDEHQRRFEFVWLAGWDGKRITHTFEAGPNNWYEKVRSILCEPEAGAYRFPDEVAPDVPDQPLYVAADELARAEQADRPTGPAGQVAGAGQGQMAVPEGDAVMRQPGGAVPGQPGTAVPAPSQPSPQSQPQPQNQPQQPPVAQQQPPVLTDIPLPLEEPPADPFDEPPVDDPYPGGPPQPTPAQQSVPQPAPGDADEVIRSPYDMPPAQQPPQRPPQNSQPQQRPSPQQRPQQQPVPQQPPQRPSQNSQPQQQQPQQQPVPQQPPMAGHPAHQNNPQPQQQRPPMPPRHDGAHQQPGQPPRPAGQPPRPQGHPAPAVQPPNNNQHQPPMPAGPPQGQPTPARPAQPPARPVDDDDPFNV